jgi:hypothetical protein
LTGGFIETSEDAQYRLIGTGREITPCLSQVHLDHLAYGLALPGLPGALRMDMKQLLKGMLPRARAIVGSSPTRGALPLNDRHFAVSLSGIRDFSGFQQANAEAEERRLMPRYVEEHEIIR